MNQRLLQLSLGFIFTINAWAGTPTPSPTPLKLELPFQSMATGIEYSDEKLDQGLKPMVVVLLDGSGSMGQLLDKKKSKMYYSKK